MISENKDKKILLTDSKDYEGEIPICDWRKLFCSARAFAKIIGVSPAMVIRLQHLGAIKKSKLGIEFLPSIRDYCETYLIPSELQKLIDRHGNILEKILQAKNIYTDPKTWGLKKIRITLPFDVCTTDGEKIKKIALAAMDGQEPFKKAVKINFMFYRKCKRLLAEYGTYHELASNITKVFEGIIFREENQIVDANILKFVGKPRAEITILELDSNDF